jgi:acetyl coenzyme A synthetase (ADP forming)-like protein
MTPETPLPLDPFFRPRAIAVVGASRRRGTIGAELFHNLLARSFPGPVYPVNHNSDVVQSVRAYSTVADIPGPVDLAVIVLPHQHVLAAIDDCARKGVRAAVVISAGFGETGAEGAALERALGERVRAAGMRLVGPNCLGLLSTEPGHELDATFAPAWPPPGNVAFSSQSGALGLAVLDYARGLGIGISQFASVGNRVDVSTNDLIEHWENDPRTRVILLYVESFGNTRRFMEIARRVSRRKPIVAVKSGRSAAGARAAGSHTGALATSDVAVDALLGQAGVIRADTIEQLFDVAALLANQPPPAGNRVAILTNAGGPAILAADACEAAGLALPAPGEATRAALAALLPPEASLGNPVDMIASASASQYESSLRLLLADPGVDAAMVLYVPPLVTTATEVAQAVLRAAEGVGKAGKPILACFIGHDDVASASAMLREARIPVYQFPENAAAALARAVSHGRWLARPEGRPLALPPGGREQRRAQVAPRLAPAEAGRPRWLGPDDVAAVLGAYGIRMPRRRVVDSEAAAIAAATEIGWPVALKIVSPTITHKTDVGGVALDLATPEALRAALRGMLDRLATLGRRGEIAGFLVEQQIPRAGVETFLGITEAADFGRLIGFGLGGTEVELQRDVVFRVNPITDVDAGEMLAQLRGAALLTGFRGRPGVDRPAVTDALLGLSALAEDFPQILAVDINPLLARPPGEGAIALDARIRVAG